MALIERIQKDLTAAMMAKDELRLSVLRMVKSALKYKEIEKVRALEDAESLQVLQTLMKQRRESVEQFTKGGRQDLADKETKEIAILEVYLPTAPSDADLSAAIEAATWILAKYIADDRGVTLSGQPPARPVRQTRGRSSSIGFWGILFLIWIIFSIFTAFWPCWSSCFIRRGSRGRRMTRKSPRA